MPPTFAKPQKRPRPAKRTQTGKIVLRVDSSARLDGASATRAIADALCAKFAAEGANVVTRDLARRPPSLLTDAWIEHAPLPRVRLVSNPTHMNNLLMESAQSGRPRRKLHFSPAGPATRPAGPALAQRHAAGPSYTCSTSSRTGTGTLIRL